jgi:hypothetical protein
VTDKNSLGPKILSAIKNKYIRDLVMAFQTDQRNAHKEYTKIYLELKVSGFLKFSDLL